MQIGAKRVEALRDLVARHCTPDLLSIVALEVFSGPSPHCKEAAVLCRIATRSDLVVTKLREDLHRAFPASIAAAADAVVGFEACGVASCIAELAAGLLRALGSHEVCFGSAGTSNEATCWVEQSPLVPGLQALTTALTAVAGALCADGGADKAAAEQLDLLRRAVLLRAPNFDSGILVKAARRKDIPILRLGEHKAIWQFGWGANSERFWVTASNGDGMVAHRIAHDKALTKRYLRQLGMPTPHSCVVGPKDDHRPGIQSIGWPCVVKPLAGSEGKGVTARIGDMAAASKAVQLARQFHPNILIETHEPGTDHRLTVIDGEMVAAVRRSADKEFEDVTAQVHPQIREMAEHLTAAFGFRAAAIDYITTDVSRSFDEVGGAVIEIETRPALHQLLAAGLSEERIGDLYLGSKPGRIPVTLIIFPDEIPPQIEVASAVQLPAGTAMATARAVRIGDLLLPDIPSNAFRRARVALHYPSVEKLLVLWTAADLRKHGLPVDRLASAILPAGCLDAEWGAALERHAGQVRLTTTIQETIDACLEHAR